MKKLTCTLIFLILTTTEILVPHQATTDIIQHEFNFSANYFTDYVYRRFYYINRLYKTMTLFFALDKNIPAKNMDLDYDIFFNLDALPFQHEEIKKSVIAIKEKRSLKPLFLIWNDFVNYRSIDDQLLVEEFTKEILVVSRNLIISSYTIPSQEQKAYFSDFFKTIALPSCTLLDIIDTYVFLFLQYNPSFAELVHSSPHSIAERKDKRIIDIKPFVHVDEVMERFYHIQRLNKPFVVLEKARRLSLCIRMDNISFSHTSIMSCIKVMHQTKTIEPLLELWEDIERYKYIHDTLFIREFFLLVYETYMDLYLQYSGEQKNNQHLVLLDAIESLPLDEILQAIDILAKELPSLLDKYEFKSDMPWKEWFKKYWWAPPLIIIAIGCKILIAIKVSKILVGKNFIEQRVP